MMFGFAAVAGAFGLFVYVSNNQAQFRRFKRQRPGASMVIVIITGYLLIHLFGSVLVFLFGIALPLSCKFALDYYDMNVCVLSSVSVCMFSRSS